MSLITRALAGVAGLLFGLAAGTAIYDHVLVHDTSAVLVVVCNEAGLLVFTRSNGDLVVIKPPYDYAALAKRADPLPKDAQVAYIVPCPPTPARIY